MYIDTTLNGEKESFQVGGRELLIDLLRRQNCFSVKHGCETGDCGACAVLVDGRPVVSCIMPAARAHGKQVVTLEGMTGDRITEEIKRQFIEAGAIQCGYCTPAMILVASALLRGGAPVSESRVRQALAGVLCRCTGYVKPVEAVLRAAEVECGLRI